LGSVLSIQKSIISLNDDLYFLHPSSLAKPHAGPPLAGSAVDAGISRDLKVKGMVTGEDSWSNIGLRQIIIFDNSILNIIHKTYVIIYHHYTSIIIDYNN
jgi:hypothetical protein